MMPSPLDDDEIPVNGKDALRTKLVWRAVAYGVIMLAGELAFEYWFTRQLSVYSIRPILTNLFLAFFISAALEAFRWWRYQSRLSRGGEVLPRDPFWFQVVEGAMAIWLLFVAAAFIRLFLL